jgi:3-polyprenyl-4-hydroxybenzoate decarboxylase
LQILPESNRNLSNHRIQLLSDKEHSITAQKGGAAAHAHTWPCRLVSPPVCPHLRGE